MDGLTSLETVILSVGTWNQQKKKWTWFKPGF